MKKYGELVLQTHIQQFEEYLQEYRKVIGEYSRPEKIKFESALEPFKRKRKLSPSQINPVLVIFSPRDIGFVKEGYDKIHFIDKVWFKYFDKKTVHEKCLLFVRRHPEYTHIIISSDDVIVSPHMVKILLDDIRKYDFPAVSGCCNQCDMYCHSNLECQWCFEKKDHPFINVTFTPIKYWKTPHLIGKNMFELYDFVTEEWRQTHPIIKQVWFQGFLLSVIRRDVFLKHALKPTLLTVHKGKKIYNYSSDFSFAVECHKHNIPQFVDFRVRAKHFGIYHTKTKLKIGMKEPKIWYECSSPERLKAALTVEPARILICSPFSNEEQSIGLYVKGLLNIDYPKELIDLVWFENGSTDNTWRKLRRYYKKIKQQCNYNSFVLMRRDFGLKCLPKLKGKEFGAVIGSGKNLLDVKNVDQKLRRGARLAAIYNYFFTILSPYHKYLVIYMADIIAPPNAITRFLEVFKKYKDAGWVGGIHHKRYPLHSRKDVPSYVHGTYAATAGVAGPLMYERNGFRYSTDEEIIKLQEQGKTVFECE